MMSAMDNDIAVTCDGIDPDTAPLTDYEITGVIRREWERIAPHPDAPFAPVASCWHCGTAITICVQIRHLHTGEAHEIGSTCAERVGLSRSGLKDYLAEFYADERAAARTARSAEARAAAEARETAETAEHGPHGTESRFESGCCCHACVKAAPHGTTHRFHFGDCRCLDCVSAVVGQDGYRYGWEMDILVDVHTGRVLIDARQVSTRYGPRWVHHDSWYPVAPKRRVTLASKGVTEAKAVFLIRDEKYHSPKIGGGWVTTQRRVALLSCPIVDVFGEPILHPAAVAS